MKVLLIEPRNCWIGLNIALGYIAAVLKQAGIDIMVLDLANNREWPERIMERNTIEAFKPDLIGISLYYLSYYPVKEMVPRIKKYYKCPIVIGGPQMMIEKEKIMEDIPELDYAIIGDGEQAIVELCDAVNGHISFSEIDGLIFRKNGEIVINKTRKINMDIDNIPFPDYEAFGIDKIKSYSIITSRGCAYHCAYCFRSTPQWRPRTPENIIEELKHAMKKYAIEEFAIVDDAFNIRPERIMRLCDLLVSNNINLPWMCTGVRADKVTNEFVKKIKRAGCYSVNIGVETLQPDLFEKLNRHMEISDIYNCVRFLKNENISINGYFLIGIPGDTKEKTLDTYKKAIKMGIDRPGFAILLPFPETEMYNMVYNYNGVNKLEDYRYISTYWSYDPRFSRMKTAFETIDYKAKEKIEMYNKLRTMVGDPRPPYHKNLLVFGFHALLWIFKYDLPHFHFTIYRFIKSALSRLIKSKGKHVYLYDIKNQGTFVHRMNKILKGEYKQ